MSAVEKVQIDLSFLRGLQRIKGKNKYTHSNLKLTRQPSLCSANTHTLNLWRYKRASLPAGGNLSAGHVINAEIKLD